MRLVSLTTLGCCGLLIAALLACKRKKEEAPAPAQAAPVATASARPTAEVKPEDEVENKVFDVGDTAQATDFNLTVSDVKECKSKYTRPKQGDLLLGVEVLVGSDSESNFYASYTAAKVVDSEGLVHNSMGYASTRNCDPMLKGTRLAQGEKAKGWLVFEVPKEASGLKLSYNPVIIGDAQTVKFDLGR